MTRIGSLTLKPRYCFGVPVTWKGFLSGVDGFGTGTESPSESGLREEQLRQRFHPLVSSRRTGVPWESLLASVFPSDSVRALGPYEEECTGVAFERQRSRFVSRDEDVPRNVCKWSEKNGRVRGDFVG